MTPRIHIVTLGVADLAKSRAFYHEGLDFPIASENDQIVFMQLGPTLFGLYPRNKLAEDATITDDGPASFSGVTLAHNCEDEATVDAVLAEAVACGAKLVKPGQKVFWGGYSGYFADPDGHLWEVAHNPFAAFDENGNLTVPTVETPDE